MRRSMLFLPGNNPNMLINGNCLGADAVIFDLEDAVSPAEKDAARILVRNTMKYMCEPCGYIYDPAEGDPDNGIAPGTAFEDLPDDWCCPVCGVGKDDFVPCED